MVGWFWRSWTLAVWPVPDSTGHSWHFDDVQKASSVHQLLPTASCLLQLHRTAAACQARMTRSNTAAQYSEPSHNADRHHISSTPTVLCLVHCSSHRYVCSMFAPSTSRTKPSFIHFIHMSPHPSPPLLLLSSPFHLLVHFHFHLHLHCRHPSCPRAVGLAGCAEPRVPPHRRREDDS